jgi:ureidoacrylate peracid hydrolase
MPTLSARPEPIDVDFARSAIVVVDMQNAFAKKGGMLDVAGVDVSDAPPVLASVRVVVDIARRAGVQIVFLQMGYKADLSDAGGPNSPNPRKELGLCLMRRRPELKGTILTQGSWDFAIVDELKPLTNDLVIVKTRYSGFAGTTLDSQLRARDIRYLFFTGIATNVCVESTLRDSYFLDYWPILVVDGTMAAGGPSAQEATLFNVESFFGWTTRSEDLVAAMTSHNG